MVRKDNLYAAREWPSAPIEISFSEIILLEQSARFMEIDPEFLLVCNSHHPVASVIQRTINAIIGSSLKTKDKSLRFILDNLCQTFIFLDYRFDEKNLKQELKSLDEGLEAGNYYRIPQVIHGLFNKVFVGDFTPVGALLKLEWMFHEDRYYCGDNKKNLMDFLFFISSLYYKNVFTEEDLQLLIELRNDDSDFLNLDLLDRIKLEIRDIIVFLKDLIFHPYWGREEYKKYFLLLTALKSSDNLTKAHMSRYAEYSDRNGIKRITPYLNEHEVYVIKSYLKLFSY